MKTILLATVALIASISSTLAQDSPATAVSLIHSWADAKWYSYTFETLSDSPESDAIGPDSWFTFVATSPSLVPHVSSFENLLLLDYSFQLFTTDMTEVQGVDGYEWNNLVVGQTYLLSATLTDTNADLTACASMGLTNDSYYVTGDTSHDGITTMTDILVFLAMFGGSGKLDSDFNLNQMVDTNDLLVLLIALSNEVNDPCY